MCILSEILIVKIKSYNEGTNVKCEIEEMNQQQKEDIKNHRYFESNVYNLNKLLTLFINLNHVNIDDNIKSKFFKDFEELALEAEYLIKLDKNNKDFRY